MTKPCNPLFRNTPEHRVNVREDICSFHIQYLVLCRILQVRCGRAVIGAVHSVVTSVVRISLLDILVNAILCILNCHFCSPLLVSVFLILLTLSDN